MNEHQYNVATSLMCDIELKTRLINDIKNIIERLNVFEGHNCEFYIKVLGAYPETKFCINFTKKINETIKESLEESKEKYKAEIKELRRNLKHYRSRTMEIRTKFNVGDVIYTINENYEAQTCKICEGKKTVRIKNMEFGCPHCNCLGVTQDKIVWTVEDEIRISAIRTYSLEETVEIRYFDYKQDIVAYEEDCFATKEEAQAECDKRNKGE